MNGSELAVEVKLTKRNYLKFQLAYLARQWYIWLFTLLFLISIGTIISYLVKGQLSEIPGKAWFIALFYIFLFVITIRSTKKMYESKWITERKTYFFSSEQVMMKSDSTEQRLFWQDIQKAQMTKSMLALFISANTAHLIPLDSLPDNQRNSLLHLVTQKFQKPKKNVIMSIFLYLVLFLVVVEGIQLLANQ